MPDFARNERYRASLDTLRRAGVVPAVAERLRADTESANRAAVELTVEEVTAYTASGNPDVLPELRQHIAGHTEAVMALLADRNPDEVRFVTAHARRRAEQKFPLEALVHSFRCTHKALLPWIRNASLAVASDDAHVQRVVAAVTDLLAEYIDSVGRLAINEYVAHTRRFAEAEGDRRTELLSEDTCQHAVSVVQKPARVQGTTCSQEP